MAYIGNSPAHVGNFQVVDDISSTFNGTLTSFALTALTLPINPAKSGQLLVSINGVLQEPDDTGTEGFKVSGSNIVFSSAPATGSTFWAVWQGQAVDIGTPSDGVVGTAQMSYPLDNFASTGIDDNATSTKITVADTGIDVTGPITATDFIGPLNGAVQFTAKNDEGVAITKGQVVYIKGISGDVATVGLADANDPTKMPAFGLVFADANNNASVEVVSFGSLKDTKTDYAGWALGDTLYVSTTAGTLTNSAPTGETSSIQNIGKVQRVHATAGIIKVGGAGRTNATPNLDEGNVFIGNASNQAVSVDLSTVSLPLAGGTMTGTVAGFTSTGIDDNATSTAITIDSAENVGIGTTPLTSKSLVVQGGNNLDTATQIRVVSTASDYSEWATKDTTTRFQHVENAGDAANGYGLMEFKTNPANNPAAPNRGGFVWSIPASASAMRINSAGIVTTPNQPAFLANLGTAVTLSSSPQTLLKFTSEIIDVGNNHNPTTGFFTAPVAGTYMVTWGGTTRMQGSESYATSFLEKNGANYGVARNRSNNDSGDKYNGQTITLPIYLAASDYINIRAYNNGTNTSLVVGEYSFGVYLLG